MKKQFRVCPKVRGCEDAAPKMDAYLIARCFVRAEIDEWGADTPLDVVLPEGSVAHAGELVVKLAESDLHIQGLLQRISICHARCRLSDPVAEFHQTIQTD